MGELNIRTLQSSSEEGSTVWITLSVSIATGIPIMTPAKARQLRECLMAIRSRLTRCLWRGSEASAA